LSWVKLEGSRLSRLPQILGHTLFCPFVTAGDPCLAQPQEGQRIWSTNKLHVLLQTAVDTCFSPS
jgi:hypothetical protein